MKPGWQSSEFWITLLGQLLTLLVLTGTVSIGDKDKLETAVTNMVTAIFTIISSGVIVVRYIRSRSELKSQALAAQDETPPRSMPPLALPLVGIALLFGAGLAQAAPPSAPACLFFRQQPRTDPAIMAMLQQLAQNQQTIITLLQQQQKPPAAPTPMIVLVPQGQGYPQQIPLGGPPRYDIPLGGPPRYEIPLGGPPRYEIPLGGPPRYEIPLGGPPHQQVPLGGPPQVQPMPVNPAPQQIPLNPPPRQDIPLGTPVPGTPNPSAMQRYSPR